MTIFTNTFCPLSLLLQENGAILTRELGQPEEA